MVRRSDAAIVLDAGAVIGLARGNTALRAMVTKAHLAGNEIIVPMVVLAETVRGNGPRDAAVNLTLAQLTPHPPLDEPTARLAGSLLGAAGSSATIDALVAAEALRRAPSLLFTGDPDDLRALLDGQQGVSIERV